MTTNTSFDRGPYLLAAFVCEKVLTEQDGVKSAIRIIDRVTRTVVGPSPPEEMEPFDHEMTLLIKLKSGEARGSYPLRIDLVKPSKEKAAPLTQTIFFEGEEDRGIDILTQMGIRFDQTGVYWFHVYLSDVKLTQIPFRVIYLPQVRQTSGTGGGLPPAEPPPRS